MIHSLQIEKTMTKTVVVKRKAKRAGIGVNRCEYLRNEHHFPVAVRNVLTEWALTFFLRYRERVYDFYKICTL